MAAELCAEAVKADGIVDEAQGYVPEVHQPTGRAGDRVDQPDSPGMGELLCGGAFEPVLFVCQRLGRKEDSAAPDASAEARRIRLETVE